MDERSSVPQPRTPYQSDVTDMIPVPQAAELAGCHPKTLHRAIERGELAARQRSSRAGRRKFVARADLLAWAYGEPVADEPARARPAAAAAKARRRPTLAAEARAAAAPRAGKLDLAAARAFAAARAA
jgi:hypothetical protein